MTRLSVSSEAVFANTKIRLRSIKANSVFATRFKFALILIYNKGYIQQNVKKSHIAERIQNHKKYPQGQLKEIQAFQKGLKLPKMYVFQQKCKVQKTHSTK